MDFKLLCPKCEKIVTLNLQDIQEIGPCTPDLVTCSVCHTIFPARSCFKKGGKLGKIILHKDKTKLYFPDDIADYFHK